MRNHTGLSFSLCAAMVLALASCATTAPTGMLAPDAPRALVESGPVSVSWNDPATFSELRQSSNRWAASEGDWLQDLAQYMRKQAQQQLAPGERLELNIIDIQRAGQYEPWHGVNLQNAHIVRDLYPPRMTVAVKRYNANGVVVDEGVRKLSDQAFLLNATPLNDTDPLRYEKRMVDTWLRRELRTSAR